MGDDPETLNLGNYDVLKTEEGSQWRLGQGAYGTTFKAEHRHLRRIAALKVINDALVQNNQARQRFLHEAQSAASLDHANIAKIYDFGDQDGIFYYAMEFCEGGTLEDLSVKRGGLPWEDVCVIARGIGRALEHAHAKSLLHRDLKPANAMLRHPGDLKSVKLIDFGLVKVLDPEKSDSTNLALTREGSFMGNPLTASPEQLNEEDLDERSDLFSLGITLWYLLIGKSPFENVPAAKVVHERLTETPYLDKLPADLSPHARAVIGKLIEKKHDDRFSSATDFLEALDDATFGEPTLDDDEPEESEPTPSSPPAQPAPPVAQAREVVITGKIVDVTSGSFYRANYPDSEEKLSVLYPPKAHIDAVAQHLATLTELPPCSVLRYHHEARFQDDRVLVFDSIDGFPLGELLKAKGAQKFRRSLAILRPIAEAVDLATKAGLPGLELHPESIWVSPSSTPGEDPPYRVQLLPLLVAPDQPLDTAATLAGSDLDTPACSQFAALVYRFVAGMAVKQMAFHTTNAYVNTADLCEDSNRYLCEAISNAHLDLSAGEVLATLAQLEGTPLDAADPALLPAEPVAPPPKQKLSPPPGKVEKAEPHELPGEIIPPPPPRPEKKPEPPPRKKKKNKAEKKPAAQAPSESEKLETQARSESGIEPAKKPEPQPEIKAAPIEPALELEPPQGAPSKKAAKLVPPPSKSLEPRAAPTSAAPKPTPPKPASSKPKKKRGLLVPSLLILALAAGGAVVFTNKDLKERLFGATTPGGDVGHGGGVAGNGEKIPLTINGLLIRPTPLKIVIKKGPNSNLESLPGNARGVYQLSVDSNLRDAYHWPLTVEVQHPGYEVSETITLSKSALLVSKASASLNANNDYDLLPTRTLKIIANYNDREVPLTPSEVTVKGGSVTQAPNGSNSLRMKGPAGKNYPLTVTLKVPGFYENTKALTLGDQQLTVDLQRHRGTVTLSRPNANREPDFSSIKLLPRPEDFTNGIQRKLLDTSLPIVRQATGRRLQIPTGSYDVKIADGIWEGASLGILTVSAQPSTLQLPGPIQGVYLGKGVRFQSLDVERGAWDSVPADAIIWLNKDSLGPRFVCFLRHMTKLNVEFTLAAPLQPLSFDSNSNSWTFKVDWRSAIDRHEELPVPDKEFLRNAGGMNPSTIILQPSLSAVTCTFEEQGVLKSKSTFRCSWIARDLAAGKARFLRDPLFSKGKERIPLNRLTLERWFGTGN